MPLSSRPHGAEHGPVVSETDLVAFLDESKKPVRDPAARGAVQGQYHYVIASAVVLSGDLQRLRDELSRLAPPPGVPLHYGDIKGAEGRQRCAEAVAGVDSWDGFVYETAAPVSERGAAEHFVRSKLLQAALVGLTHEQGVVAVTLESRAKPSSGFHQLDAKDHQVLQKLVSRNEVPARLRLAHGTKLEPLLWIPDTLAGARTDHLCAVNRIPYAPLGARVRGVVAVPLARRFR